MWSLTIVHMHVCLCVYTVHTAYLCRYPNTCNMRPIYRYCLTGRMQFNSSRWLSCIFNYTNISCRSSIQSSVIIFVPTCLQPITIIPTKLQSVSYWLSGFCVAKVTMHKRYNSNRTNKPYTEIHVTWDVMLCYWGSGFLCFENHSP
jgi:hypothetical protein